jgi:ribosome recycling factor
MHKGLDHIQKITDKVIDKIEDIYKAKEKEILEV